MPKSLSILSPPGVSLFEATYSGVDVYELIVNGHSLMRRRDDSWVNATHILKIANVEKGRRTKILEREVHHEQHEKVQGGYGKYQGTWIPCERARSLARDFQVYDYCASILDLP
ncbi:transcription regulator HTH, apses-type DNA-binding domain-containing protein [Globomyces pollinis-pini]|nr:transcription regulator HTH, apses-type DNA-binding domain-containing protein [Globomyces pollinis-pini]